MDMHSGGGCKEDFAYCYIEAPRRQAEAIFYAMFGHNPYRVTCSCCGSDYSVSESETLEEATAYDRGLRYAQLQKVVDFYDAPFPTMSELKKGKAPAVPRPTNEEFAAGQYLEPHEEIPEGMAIRSWARNGRVGVTLEEFEQNSGSGIRIIRASEITDEQRNTHVPEEEDDEWDD